MPSPAGKISINDLRAEKGGDPDHYKHLLSCADPCDTSPTVVDEALALDAKRRSKLSELEDMRSKLSTLQKTVIAPKKKAGLDCDEDIAKMKGWKADIDRLSTELKVAEKERDGSLKKISDALATIDVNSDGTSAGCRSESGESPKKGPQSPAGPALQKDSPKKQTKSDSSTDETSLPLLQPEKIKQIPPERILNLNVGVLGHVDTGKTSLVKTLSSVLSTASLDKSKQSRARGITLDLGFSAFLLPLPEHLRKETMVRQEVSTGKSDATKKPKNAWNIEKVQKKETETELQQRYDLLQVTLVDCPGHASLIRTIIGGAQIIDMVLLVVDATKGIQTQTAECLVIAEMTTRNLIVVLNKIDLFPANEREERLRQAEKKMRNALRGTKFENAQMVGISACVGGEKVAAVGQDAAASVISSTNNIHGLLNVLQSQMRAPNRDTQPSPERFHFAVDHCFPIKGQGTVLTGTCLSGSARPNDLVEFPTLATQKKIKGLQMFRRKANVIQQGDRAGICVSNFDAKLMERGIVAAPGTVRLIRGAIAVVRKVRFFKGGLNSGAKFHISVGHTTVMATVTFWGAREIARQAEEHLAAQQQSVVENGESHGKSSLGGSADLAGLPRLRFDWDQDFLHQDNYLDSLPDDTDWGGRSSHQPVGKQSEEMPLHWARIEFLTPVYCPMDSLVIGSRLDSEVNANACRLAFSGRLVERYDAKSDNGRLRSYTKKEKVGTVCRLGDPYKRGDDGKIVRYEVFGTDLFKKETNMTQFVGLLIETDAGDVGIIQSSFGTSGKFRVSFPAGTEVREGDPLYLRFKRYANDPRKAIRQDGSVPAARTGSRVDPPAKKKKGNRGGKGGGNKAKSGGTASSSSHVVRPPNGTGARPGAGDTCDSEVTGEIAKLKDGPTEGGRPTVAIASGLFSMEDDIGKHRGRRVVALSTDEEGAVDGSFGKMGKCKVLFKGGVSAEVGSKLKMMPR